MTFKNIKTADDLAAEKLAQENAQKVQEAKSYLVSTDWIMTKITEQYLLTGNVDSLTTKYADELTKREEARALINELQA